MKQQTAHGLAEDGAEDFKGHSLCKPCWNGQHFIQGVKGFKKGREILGAKYHNCDGGLCECPCRIMVNEDTRRPRKDNWAQTTIVVEAIEIK